MAEECRGLAAEISDQAVRSQLLAVAEHFDRLADGTQLWGMFTAVRPKEHSC